MTNQSNSSNKKPRKSNYGTKYNFTSPSKYLNPKKMTDWRTLKRRRNARIEVIKRPPAMLQYGDPNYRPSTGRGVSY